jgi:glutathione synthase/RimK-type ligase-like ATP-grasp enzyme
MVRSVPHEIEEQPVPSVALATCREFPDLDDEDRLLIPALADRGVDAVPAVWTDAAVDWASFDAVVIRATWDYPADRPGFLAWTEHVEEASLLLNPAPVVRWNTDKRYLSDLADAGLPVVPTVFLEPGTDHDGWTPGEGDFVVKPAVSGGSRDTMRYTSEGPNAAHAHVERLLAEGRTVMVQPYLEAVDTIGETAVLFIGGDYSHAIRKGPLLVRDVEAERVGGLFVQEEISRRDPTMAELALARNILECIPGGFDQVLYARVDLIHDADGNPRLLELELTEPSMFLSHSEDAPARMAKAIGQRLSAVRVEGSVR